MMTDRVTLCPGSPAGRGSAANLASFLRRDDRLRPAACQAELPRAFRELGADLAVGVPLLEDVPLLVLAPAADEGDLDLDLAPVVEQDLGRDEGEAALLDLLADLPDLPLVEQEPALAQGLVIEDVGGVVGAGVAPNQEDATR